MSTATTIEDKAYDDLTVEDVEAHHQEALRGIEFNKNRYKETGQVSDTFWDYVVATEVFGSVHHKALIEERDYTKALKQAGDALRDSAVAYVNDLEAQVELQEQIINSLRETGEEPLGK